MTSTLKASDAVIQLEGLTKDYEVGFLKKKTARALDNLSLNVYRGEVFGFLGPNGAGKTTTLKLLMQLIYPTSGNARILGQPIDSVATRARIGYLPENPYFYDYLSGRELLLYSAALFGIARSQAHNRTDELLQAVGLDKERANRQLRKYSKGMLQRIGIAQALVNDPDVLFLDEPMSGLDPIGRREVRDLLLSLREKKKTIFFSSHILSDVEAMCDRVAILQKGRLTRYGTVQEMTVSQDASFEVIAINTEAAHWQREADAKGWLLAVTETPNGVHLIVKDEDAVNQALKSIRATGGHLVSVSPRRKTLEDFFHSELD